jgi:CRISPR-associated protein Cmr2
VSQVFWQAKIWGILHDPVFKALHFNSGRGKNAPWQELVVMKDWVDNGLNPEKSKGKVMDRLKLADLITSASDRGAIGNLWLSVNYASKEDRQYGLKISHLLSAKQQDFKLKDTQHKQIITGSRKKVLLAEEAKLFDLTITELDENKQSVERTIKEITNPQKLFWWLWRCLPVAACNQMGEDENLFLMPAETRIPDASIWSHTSMTAAMAGALTGFDLTIDDLKKWPNNQPESHAYLATFSFSPVQEFIKASRKMRDFWAGSWLLHYLAARVSWKLALKYGPDSLVYPSLFEQPLIDAWLLEEWPDFAKWINKPPIDQDHLERRLLTAGFPNVLVLLLPEGKVSAAMQYAKQTLEEEWLKVSHLVFLELQGERHWMPGLTENHPTWNGWLKNQWQTYWSAMPVGDRKEELRSNEIYQTPPPTTWRDQQNLTFQVTGDCKPFSDNEWNFIDQAAQYRRDRYGKHPCNANVGSWWPYIFDLNRQNLAAVKNARIWQLPTAFDSRSTISGWGSIVHPFIGNPKVADSEIKTIWQNRAGLFDGKEQLNATEVVKRTIHLVIPRLVECLPDVERIDASYPDLTAGAVGYLKTKEDEPAHLQHFRQVCDLIEQKISEMSTPFSKKLKLTNLPNKAGIPWIKTKPEIAIKAYHPRHLSPSWLIEDVEMPEDYSNYRPTENLVDPKQKLKEELQSELQKIVDNHYSGNNPTDWYVLAAGDGDGMSQWLKGEKMRPYQEYIPDKLVEKVRSVHQKIAPAFIDFLGSPKRMGPSTHGALSRALLDFSNRLVPYLTEQRYAGRLIYSGGDDVLAYTNLWEWDSWLWDIRQCFRGDQDPSKKFDHDGDYWKWKTDLPDPENLTKRPLFTMGRYATISFGIVIANQGVPLAIALENMWEAEKEAKNHFCAALEKDRKKDAVQVRILYANGNILKATAKFKAFAKWRCLLNQNKEAALFEQAAEVWSQHPAPCAEAIEPWVRAFSDRRDALKNEESQPEVFREDLSGWIQEMWKTTDEADRIKEIGCWLKLAAFVIRKRHIEIKGG